MDLVLPDCLYTVCTLYSTDELRLRVYVCIPWAENINNCINLMQKNRNKIDKFVLALCN